MAPIRRAVIDVGTNSVKLLVADVADHDIQPVCEQSKQTRLGHGFYESRRLQAEAITATATAVAAFGAIALAAHAVSIRVIATSAAREAMNREEFIAAIEHAAGLKVEVISGDQEADWGFQGVTTDPQLAKASLLLLDVGGGSTQFTLGHGGHTRFRHSFPIGSVRLQETFPCSDPPKPAELSACRDWLKDFLRKEVRPNLMPAMGDTESGLVVDQSLSASDTWKTGGSPSASSPALAGTLSQSDGEREGVRGPTSPPRSAPMTECGSGAERLPASAGTGSEIKVQLVGVGGAATILGCMEAKLQAFDRARIEATRLSAARVSWHLERLWSLPLAARKETIGLPRNRADVILMGVAVYQGVMEEFGFCELRISTRGLRFAALME